MLKCPQSVQIFKKVFLRCSGYAMVFHSSGQFRNPSSVLRKASTTMLENAQKERCYQLNSQIVAGALMRRGASHLGRTFRAIKSRYLIEEVDKVSARTRTQQIYTSIALVWPCYTFSEKILE